MPDDTWEQRIARLWDAFEQYQPNLFVQAIDQLVTELNENSAIGFFEKACAQDSTGHPEIAVPLYREALRSGLSGTRQRRAVIQLASSLRNLGRPEEAVELLTKERNSPSDELDGAVDAFLALALTDMGKEREAITLSLTALSRYLPRYNKSLARYARAIAGDSE